MWCTAVADCKVFWLLFSSIAGAPTNIPWELIGKSEAQDEKTDGYSNDWSFSIDRRAMRDRLHANVSIGQSDSEDGFELIHNEPLNRDPITVRFVSDDAKDSYVGKVHNETLLSETDELSVTSLDCCECDDLLKKYQELDSLSVEADGLDASPAQQHHLKPSLITMIWRTLIKPLVAAPPPSQVDGLLRLFMEALQSNV